MRDELAQLRVRLVGQHEVVERERRRDERCQPLERMLGLPSRGRPHEVAVDRPSRPRRVEPHPLQHRRDVALGERKARGELARQLLQLGPDGGAGAAAGIRPRQAPPARALPVRHVPAQAARPYRRRPRARRARPTRAAARPPPSSRARRSRPPARRAPRRRAARAASARLRSGRGRSARGRRPPPPPRRPRDGRFPPARARAPRSGRRAAGRRAPSTAPASRAGAATGARRGVGASPSRNCRAVAVRRSGPAAPAAGSTTPAATSVPRSSSADGDGDPERLEHEPQQAGGHVAPRAVVVRAAEQRRELGIGLRPPGGGDHELLAARQPEAIAQVRERIVRRLRRLEQRLDLRTKPRSAPAGVPTEATILADLGAGHLIVRSSPQRRAAARGTRRTRSAAPRGRAGAASLRSRRDLDGRHGPGDLAGAQRDPGRPRRGGGRDRDRHLGRRDERDRAWVEAAAVQEHLDVRGRMGRVEVGRRPLRERPAGPRDDRDDGEADAVPPDEEPGLGDGDVEPARRPGRGRRVARSAARCPARAGDARARGQSPVPSGSPSTRASVNTAPVVRPSTETSTSSPKEIRGGSTRLQARADGRRDGEPANVGRAGPPRARRARRRRRG